MKVYTVEYHDPEVSTIEFVCKDRETAERNAELVRRQFNIEEGETYCKVIIVEREVI